MLASHADRIGIDIAAHHDTRSQELPSSGENSRSGTDIKNPIRRMHMPVDRLEAKLGCRMPSGAAGHSRMNFETQKAGRRRVIAPWRRQKEPAGNDRRPGFARHLSPVNGFFLAQFGYESGKAPHQLGRVGRSLEKGANPAVFLDDPDGP